MLGSASREENYFLKKFPVPKERGIFLGRKKDIITAIITKRVRKGGIFMETKPSCPFQQVCICFTTTLCFSTSIDSKECGGPTIRGLRIVAVANISSGNHKIAIISQCPEPECGKILGVVTGDTEPVPYRPNAVTLTEEIKKRIPQVICQKCLEHPSHGWIALDVTDQKRKASATA